MGDPGTDTGGELALPEGKDDSQAALTVKLLIDVTGQGSCQD